MRRARNIRARVAAVQRARGQIENIPEESQEEDEEEGSDMFERAEKDEEEQKLYTGKIGTKKLKKIQEKAERKAAREVSSLTCLFSPSLHAVLYNVYFRV